MCFSSNSTTSGGVPFGRQLIPAKTMIWVPSYQIFWMSASQKARSSWLLQLVMPPLQSCGVPVEKQA
ncbi:hypothetical protein Trydic_g23848 [Trypoxylus dichotomus]